MMYKRIVHSLTAAALVMFLVVACQHSSSQPQTYLVGILQFVDMLTDVEDGFKAGMAELGYIEGENVEYVRRSAQGNMDVLDRLAQELVDEQADLIVSITTPASVAVQQAIKGTDTPVVFVLVSDPVQAGLVDTLKKPGGNMTGIRDAGTITAGKRLELLYKMTPGIQTVLSVYSYQESLLAAEEQVREAAKKLGLTLVEKQVHTAEEAVVAFQSIQPDEIDAIYVASDGIITEAQEAIQALAMRDHLPYIFPGKAPGVLAFHGENIPASGRQAASLADKILQGESPATLPVEFTNEFYLGIDVGMAEEMGVTLSEEILAIADEVIR
jgi:putative ABC transport system substrate-binding protein